MTEYTVVTQSFVSVTILTEAHEFGVEKRFAKDITIVNLKDKLELICGYMASDMKLKLLNKEKKYLCDIDDESKMLGFYPVEDGYFLQVNATKSVLGPGIGEDDPNFKKFELTDEEYAKKKGTVKEFKQKNKLGQYADHNKELVEQKEREAKEKIETEKKLIESMKVGDRCQVKVANAPTRLGTVMYLGELVNKPGHFVGVKYDEPLGKNDGTADGKRYFQCLPNYGGFVKPECITVGDFPEENFDEL
jgi:tubulin-folding cofactor B